MMTGHSNNHLPVQPSHLDAALKEQCFAPQPVHGNNGHDGGHHVDSTYRWGREQANVRITPHTLRGLGGGGGDLGGGAAQES